MKTKSTLRGILSLVSFAGITLCTLLSVVGCDNKDYSNDSPFDNVVYLDVAKLKDYSCSVLPSYRQRQGRIHPSD